MPVFNHDQNKSILYMNNSGEADAPVLGLREQNKLEKLSRIKAAARELFTELGYDAATTRDIAKRARVGLGTLFNYADDKRDLIFLIYVDHLNDIQHRAQQAISPRKSLLEQLVSFFSFLYEDFAGNPTLSRILLRELTFYRHGKLSGEFNDNRLRVIDTVRQLVVEAQKKGRIHSRENPATIALGLFYVYAGAVRLWISEDDPDLKEGLATLRKHFRIYINGLNPAK